MILFVFKYGLLLNPTHIVFLFIFICFFIFTQNVMGYTFSTIEGKRSNIKKIRRIKLVFFFVFLGNFFLNKKETTLLCCYENFDKRFPNKKMLWLKKIGKNSKKIQVLQDRRTMRRHNQGISGPLSPALPLTLYNNL